MDDSHRQERELKIELTKQSFKDAQISAVCCINVSPTVVVEYIRTENCQIVLRSVLQLCKLVMSSVQ